MLDINDKQRAELEDLSRSSQAPRALSHRSSIILASSFPDMSVMEIARQHDVSPATVRHWQRRYRECGLTGLDDAQRTGAPRRIDDAMRTAILDLHAAGTNTRCIASKIGVSQSSISRIIREAQRIAPSAPAPTILVDTIVEQLAIELFESLADETPLVRFLNRIEAEIGADYSIMLIFSRDKRKPSLILSKGPPLEGTASYLEKYYQQELLADIPEGTVVTVSDLLSPGELRATAFYREYLTQYGVGHILGVDIGNVRGVSGKLRLTRLETRQDFGPRERAICQGLIPYLRVALNLFVKRVDMEAEKEALSITVSGMSVGSIIVDPDGHILEANQPARSMLAQRDGLYTAGESLALSNPKLSKQLYELIRRNAEASLDRSAPGLVRALLVDRPSGRESISLLVRPAAGGGQLTIRPTALIHLVDPAEPRVTMIDALIELFRLTPAEAKVALSLSNGHSVNETAQASGTSKNTVRSHVRSIFSKMGISRQPELIRTTLISVGLLSFQERGGRPLTPGLPS